MVLTLVLLNGDLPFNANYEDQDNMVSGKSNGLGSTIHFIQSQIYNTYLNTRMN